MYAMIRYIRVSFLTVFCVISPLCTTSTYASVSRSAMQRLVEEVDRYMFDDKAYDLCVRAASGEQLQEDEYRYIASVCRNALTQYSDHLDNTTINTMSYLLDHITHIREPREDVSGQDAEAEELGTDTTIIDTENIINSRGDTIQMDANLDLGNNDLITTGSISGGANINGINTADDIVLNYDQDGSNADPVNPTDDFLEIRENSNSLFRVDKNAITISSRPLNMGNNNITNVGTVDGVDVSDHSARHAPQSTQDPLPTAAAVTIGGVTTSADNNNAEGGANAFARSDHVHDHGLQPAEDSNGNPLHDIAVAGNNAGFMSASDKTKLNNVDPNNFVAVTGDTMTGTLTMDNANIDMTNGANLAMNENAINSVNNINAGSTSNTINLRNSGGTNVLTVDGATPAINANGNDITGVADLGTTSVSASGNVSAGTLSAGATTLSGGLDVGGNNITNVGTVDGVTVSSHGTRHAPDNPDPVPSGAVGDIQNVTDGSANAGGANSFARSDHVHPHGDLGGGTLHDPATTSTAGFMSAADKTKLDNQVSNPNNTFVEIAGDTMTGALTMDNANIDMTNGANLAMNENTINSVNNINAGSTSNTINLRNNGGANVLTIDGATPAINANGNDITGVADLGTTSVSASGNVSAGSVTTSTVDTSSGNLSLNPAGSDVNFNGNNITNAGTLSAGATTLSGGLDVGGNNITNVGTVDGVTVSSHGTRHAPDNPDPVPTGVVSDIQNVTDGSASAGGANSFARSDHEHPHGDLGGGTLHDPATTSTAGFMSAADKTKLDNQVSNPTNTFVEIAGDTMTGILTMDGADIDMTNSANLAMNEHAINSVNNINAGSTSNTINLRNASGINVLTVDGATPAINANSNDRSCQSWHNKCNSIRQCECRDIISRCHDIERRIRCWWK